MTITISPTTAASVGSASRTASVAPAAGVSGGVAAGGSGAAFAQALQQVDTGPLGLRPPGGAENMAALLAMVEMKLDATKTVAHNNSLVGKLQGGRGALDAAGAAFGSNSAALITGQAALASSQKTQAVDNQTLVADQQTQATDKQTLIAHRQTQTADGQTLAADQTSQDALSGQSAQLGASITALTAQAADDQKQIDAAKGNDPDADVSALEGQRGTALSQAALASIAKSALDQRVSAYVPVIAADRSAVEADAAVVAGDQASVDANAAALEIDNKAVDADGAQVSADQSSVSQAAGNAAVSNLSLGLAFGRLSTTLRTGDGQVRNDAVASHSLGRGFDDLQAAMTHGIRGAERRTVQAVTALARIHEERDGQPDVGQIAAGMTAGLAHVQSVLAGLQAQHVQPASRSTSPRDGRVLLSL